MPAEGARKRARNGCVDSRHRLVLRSSGDRTLRLPARGTIDEAACAVQGLFARLERCADTDATIGRRSAPVAGSPIIASS
jgi:hypothetical protein